MTDESGPEVRNSPIFDTVISVKYPDNVILHPLLRGFIRHEIDRIAITTSGQSNSAIYGFRVFSETPDEAAEECYDIATRIVNFLDVPRSMVVVDGIFERRHRPAGEPFILTDADEPPVLPPVG